MSYIISPEEKAAKHTEMDVRRAKIRHVLDNDDGPKPLLTWDDSDSDSAASVSESEIDAAGGGVLGLAAAMALSAINKTKEFEYLWVREAEFRRILAEIYQERKMQDRMVAELEKAQALEAEVERRINAGLPVTTS